MHKSSRLKFECFVQTYVQLEGSSAGRTILDVGSRQVSERAYSYRRALEGLDVVYTGLDIEAGLNVDIVPANPYVWDEIADESFDFVVSGQAFEHNPFMWITTAEIARVLKPGGIACIIAPSAGNVHRYPYDCWRYYPDSWAALAAVTRLDLIESIREPEQTADTVRGGNWMDSVAILQKTPFADDDSKENFYANLALIVAPFRVSRYEVVPATLNAGPCFARYLEVAKIEKKAPERRAKGPGGRRPPGRKIGALKAAMRRERRAANSAT